MDFRVENSQRSGSLQLTVYERLKDSILNLSLKPGEKISEMKVAAAMKCSRAPVRDAFRQLQHQGFLEVRPQIGTFVPLINLAFAEEARFIRESLEVAVIKYGIRNGSLDQTISELQRLVDEQDKVYQQKEYAEFYQLDTRFHDLFYQATGKTFVNRYLGYMNAHYTRLRFLAIRFDPQPADTISQHQAILDAIRAKDEVQLEKALAAHLDNIYRVLESCRSEVQPYILRE